MTTESPKSSALPYFAMFCVPILYGSFYILAKITNETIPVFWMTSFRMLFAMIGFLPFIKKLRKTDLHSIKYGFFLALIFFGGVVSQTEGLKSIEAGKAGFISGLFVVITPLLSWVLFRTKISRFLIIPIVIVVIGLFIMFYDPTIRFFNVGIGEFLNFIGALCIALHIIVLGKGLKEGDFFCLAFYQTFFAFCFSFILALIFEPSYQISTTTLSEWSLLIYLGLAIGTIPFLLQNWGQQYIKDSRAAIIISIEPVFATIFGGIFGGELITWQIVLGGLLILTGLIITVVTQQKETSNI
ncbi:hypothetical protein NEF87_003806 [Candidatus Lokiarchaeum ossiferum]|uniref:EamA domain-containing protein n=1 Tax=Candidatus Lokiarchaeum ossiferum TaxID=2951803 RepID=A0ABY6HY68_9ARCH|nr:hypothetical protein NEF87_003806 [Candidatus Lokiarchaeum sp. B-35]